MQQKFGAYFHLKLNGKIVYMPGMPCITVKIIHFDCANQSLLLLLFVESTYLLALLS